MIALTCPHSTTNRLSFDWRAIVAQRKASMHTSIGREQPAIITQMTEDIQFWLHSHNLSTQRANTIAYTGIIGTPEPTDYDQALLLAKFASLIFRIDEYFDTCPSRPFDPKDPIGQLWYIDRMIFPLSQVLLESKHFLKHLSQADHSSHLFQFPTRMTKTTHYNSLPQESIYLSKALRDFILTLIKTWSPVSQWPHEWCLQNVISEFAIALKAMSNEVYQNFRFYDTNKLPTLEHYLEQAHLSICLRAGGALAAGFEEFPQMAWARWVGAMEVAGRVVRLANDLGSLERELEERKVTSITITLAELGYDPTAPYDVNSPEITHAKAIVQERLDAELDQLARRIARTPAGPLADYVINCTAFTVAMYEHGDYVLV
ncbi:MAG: hypothetical protein GFH27_549301n276 [Chloroflexi bacterium AL-W]|nr:hypothetical protein [Chloroflexi bacterium AL-N1]NOK68470.1 hypothetical protein [Chloroflexi bacterium AL-N10]NOK74116.1 hypothetical protein [Chloroflexi bacterium AL-N5]NOK83083.1 hypothetical protein [Chloroflexi bacterium AL-W]NOK90606.1 hypothetical protein [Chloroflexi bacterium AL-N15]